VQIFGRAGLRVFHSTFARGALVLLSASALQACGGGGGSETSAPVTGNPGGSPAASNSAPTISGSPSQQVTAGQAFTFTPQASDADGDTLTFSIQNKPAWAAFDTATGRLSGTPSANGTFSNVTISVTDGKATASLTRFTLTVGGGAAAGTGSATLAWAPPTQRQDGSTLSNLAGYRIYYGPSATNLTESVLIDTPGVTQYTVDNLSAGTWSFVITAVDADGNESSYSAAASKTIG
jgi:hypothetical protein